MPRVSIIIVSWNVRGLLESCLRSIELAGQGIEYEIIIVDNASSDGTPQLLRDKYPGAQLIANENNRGFAAATNQGLRAATGTYLLLLNPDTELRPDTLTMSLQLMAKYDRCGALGCQIRNPDGSLQSSVRRFPWWRPLSLMLLKLPKLTQRSYASIDSYLATDFDYARPARVDQIMGAYMLVRRSALTEVGGFDERFFLWFEEVDFCARLWAAGWAVLYTPQTHIIHHGGQSFAQETISRKQKLFFASAWKYCRKHGFSQPKSHLEYGYHD